jgi:hypothetical protein
MDMTPLPRIHTEFETMRIGDARVRRGGLGLEIVVAVEDDNGNPVLPESYRRWWHFELTELPTDRTTTLHVTLRNCGYEDTILPVWSLNRGEGHDTDYARMPLSAMPTRSGSSQRFTVEVPVGVRSVRMAKYFPWTVADCDAWIEELAPQPPLRRILTLGMTEQQRPIRLLEFSAATWPDTHKRRVWIQAGVHPSETPGYFIVQGLVAWLRSGAPSATQALRHLILDIVPMCNPDGVACGNYRTNSRSNNSEIEWTRPYNSKQPEVVAVRQAIEARMGTPAKPAPQPIELLLNLHATHDFSYPLHFLHTANPSFDLERSRGGVLPEVHAKELRWIAALEARSPWMRHGTILHSQLGDPVRPYLESMLHDRWSIDPAWIGEPRQREEVMAITFEGSYGKGPSQDRWNTTDDYRELGRAMGLALLDYFEIPGSELTV